MSLKAGKGEWLESRPPSKSLLLCLAQRTSIQQEPWARPAQPGRVLRAHVWLHQLRPDSLISCWQIPSSSDNAIWGGVRDAGESQILPKTGSRWLSFHPTPVRTLLPPVHFRPVTHPPADNSQPGLAPARLRPAHGPKPGYLSSVCQHAPASGHSEEITEGEKINL